MSDQISGYQGLTKLPRKINHNRHDQHVWSISYIASPGFDPGNVIFSDTGLIEDHMVYHLPATKSSQPNYKAHKVNRGFHPLLSLLNDSGYPPEEAHWWCFQLHLQEKALVSRDSLSHRKADCSFQPKFLSIWPDLNLPSDVKSSLEIWGDVRIRGKKQQVALSLISHSFKNWVLMAIIWLRDIFQEEPHKYVLNWTNSTTWQSFQDAPSTELHTRPQFSLLSLLP